MGGNVVRKRGGGKMSSLVVSVLDNIPASDDTTAVSAFGFAKARCEVQLHMCFSSDLTYSKGCTAICGKNLHSRDPTQIKE